MMKKLRVGILLLLSTLFAVMSTLPISTLQKNDPYPLYTTAYPYSYLLTQVKNYLKGLTDCCEAQWFNLAITPFFQRANSGRDFDNQFAFLGDLEGKWHMLGLLYGPVPIPCFDLNGTVLGADKMALFSDGGVFGPAITNPNDTIPADFVHTDSGEVIGWLSVPLKYRKAGLRVEASFQPIRDFGITVQLGFADIKQTLTNFIAIQELPGNIGYLDGFTEVQKQAVFDLLISESSREAVLTQSPINLELCDFEQCTGIEDLRIFLWWHHVFQINCQPDPCNTCCCYPQFLMIPFVQFEVSAPIAKKLNRRKAFALALGNDGHTSLGFTTGFHIDFIETVEIGFYGGMTWFLSRTIDNFHVPNHPSQSGVYPFSSRVDRTPGMNGNFGILFNAYHFLECLSFHAEYAFIHHCEDKLKVLDCPEAFRPRQLECLTKWTSQMLTTAFNYDISPNLQLGFAVQWPVRQRNAYRSTTILGSIQATF